VNTLTRLQAKTQAHTHAHVCAHTPLQAKIVAMTCTHAALKRREFIDLAFKYDNLLMEEAGQILEIETFIPMLLQVWEGEGGLVLLLCMCARVCVRVCVCT